MAAVEPCRIPLRDGTSVAGRRYGADGGALLVYAHGAGAGQHHPFIARTAADLAARGVEVLTFDFRYVEAGRKAPDRAPVLLACWEDVLRHARTLGARGIVIGGKSMGGRYASLGAAAGTLEADGLVYFGYPLHPPRQPERLRDAHLPSIRAPQLFLAGTRDPLCTLELLVPLVERLPAAELAVFEGADHGFDVRRRDGIDREALLAALADRAAEFIHHVTA